MSERNPVSIGAPDHVDHVTRQIIPMFDPKKIYLYNRKVSPNGAVVSFKLCIVAAVEDKLDAERRIYRNIDSEVPFDVLIYTPEEWDSLCRDIHAFAKRIEQTGMVLYG